MHQTVLNNSDYQRLCFRGPPSNASTKTQDKGSCIVSSPLDLAGSNFEHLRNLPSILVREWNNLRTILSDGQSLKLSHMHILSNFKVNGESDPPTSQAEALRITYFIKKPTTEKKDQKVKKTLKPPLRAKSHH